MSARKILVVDDDQDMQKLLYRVLSKAGFEVVVAADGVSAMAVARAERPDAIVLDAGLPAGDGFTVLERLRGNVAMADTPVMVVTGREGEMALKARSAGADGFLRKPLDPRVLIERLEGLLPARRGA